MHPICLYLEMATSQAHWQDPAFSLLPLQPTIDHQILLETMHPTSSHSSLQAAPLLRKKPSTPAAQPPSSPSTNLSHLDADDSSDLDSGVEEALIPVNDSETHEGGTDSESGTASDSGNEHSEDEETKEDDDGREGSSDIPTNQSSGSEEEGNERSSDEGSDSSRVEEQNVDQDDGDDDDDEVISDFPVNDSASGSEDEENLDSNEDSESTDQLDDSDSEFHRGPVKIGPPRNSQRVDSEVSDPHS